MWTPEWGASKLQPVGQIWPSGYSYKVLLEHNHAPLFAYCLRLLSCYNSRAELLQQGQCGLQNLNYVLSGMNEWTNGWTNEWGLSYKKHVGQNYKNNFIICNYQYIALKNFFPHIYLHLTCVGYLHPELGTNRHAQCCPAVYLMTTRAR